MMVLKREVMTRKWMRRDMSVMLGWWAVEGVLFALWFDCVR